MKLLVAVLLAVAPLAWGQSSVLDTVHNLSASGPGTLKSSSQGNACGFCHVPHQADPKEPLWGHRLSSESYRIYKSESMDSTVPQPDGASKLCLSCHDGTIALGEMLGRRVPLGAIPPMAKGYIGTDLSGTHPVSMTVDTLVVERNNARQPTLLDVSQMRTDADGVRLDPQGRMQCTACHDPHLDAHYRSSGIRFWRKTTFSEVCLVCHMQ